MDFLVEFIMELLGEIMGEAIGSPRVPKVIRSVLICLLCVPLTILFLILLAGEIRDRNTAGSIFTALVIVIMTAMAVALLRRVWKR
ncbi:MAG: hypothetical protein IKQ39_08090 [Oscillospiraceae bacterium]|nr:hypothetical protein [Oscillospiraceae bacterium]